MICFFFFKKKFSPYNFYIVISIFQTFIFLYHLNYTLIDIFFNI